MYIVRQCVPDAFIKSSTNNSMSTTQQIFRVEDERKDGLLEILSDKYCRAILEYTMDTPKSAMELTAKTQIPISTVYRRIQMLCDNKLLVTTGTITDEGKKLFLYKSKIKGIKSKFDNGQIYVDLIFHD